MKSIAFCSLGCKVNSYELDAIQKDAQNRGYKIVDFAQKADIYLVNTCTVTNIADRKSRQMLHRAKAKNPEALVVAVGCYVQHGLEDPANDASVDLCIGNNHKGQVFDIIESFLATGQGKSSVSDIAAQEDYEELSIEESAEHTRAFIKIEDGCNQFCSYCAIPLARGRVRSRKKENIVEEARRLSERGYKEVVLTGIHVSSYGLDFLGQKSADYREAARKGLLLDVINEIAKLPGIERIRLSSLEPRIVTQEFAKALAAQPKVCPHFHLSLQSGCNETLKRMNRHYSAEEFAESVRLLRYYYKGEVAITTDVIVGFPGESEEEFETCLAFLKEIAFYELHVFRFSRRKGTVADTMKGQIREEEKARRSDILLALDRELSVPYRERYIGREMDILVEECKEIDGRAYWVGHTGDYVMGALPDGEDAPLPGEIIRVKALSLLTEDVLLVEKSS